MYSDYRRLFAMGCSPSTGITDSTRFSCGSIPYQTMVRKSIQDPQMYDVDNGNQCIDQCAKETEACAYQCSSNNSSNSDMKPMKIKESFQLPSSSSFMTHPPKKSSSKIQESEKLLPVLDPMFNLREICKQSILLEDHLSQPEKRCTDCCVKHFLTIEALAEEAITLDKSRSHSNILNLPSHVRKLQALWFEDPIQNSHTVSQELRQIRKEYQIDCFDIVFREGCDSCVDGVCKIKPKSS